MTVPVIAARSCAPEAGVNTRSRTNVNARTKALT